MIKCIVEGDDNGTLSAVTNQIFPVWTYSYLAVLVPVFLFTEWLRYKPVVVFQCLVLFSTMAMLLWCNGVPEMQAIQFTSGLVTSCDVAYFTYLYSVVELKHYLKATSYCRTAQLLGNTAGSVLGQILVSFELMSYNYILVFTLVLTAIALITSILLPMPKTSMFFHQRRSASGETDGEGYAETEEELQNNGQKDGVELNGSKQLQPIPEGSGNCDNRKNLNGVQFCCPYDIPGGCGDVLLRLVWDFLQCFSSNKLLVWSAWWALATGGYYQIINYVQLLWEYVEPSSNFAVYNGGVEALSNLLGAAAAYGISFSSVDWSRWGEVALGTLSALEGGALFAMVFSANIWVCYCGYIIFKSLYMLLITIAMQVLFKIRDFF
ncbi:thiamine transporter 2-like [Carassius auratus]|uniref:Thiamine transporter 2-like n=1 Tax=Carassius auratus TaxID=7957 RepID=A0A6P6ND65_CARAU|nr:thiamine transporter 2-like [Carassius auratus]